MSDHPILDNVLWNAFSEEQSAVTTGTGGVRRYAPGFSPIVAWEDPIHPDFESLNLVAEIGEKFYCDLWTGDAPSGWSIEAETIMFKMVFEGETPEPMDETGIVTLGQEHAYAIVELALLTNPGPIGIRTWELGDYYGFFDGDKLIALTGERMFAPPYREISAVCTHPDYRGRGLASKLINRFIRQQVLRGEIPFLHVLSENDGARNIYRKLGFRDYLETTTRVIRRIA